MKEKELFVDYEAQQLVYYVEKEDASYGQVVSGSYLAKHYLDDYFSKVKHWDESMRKQLEKGEISPIYYYMIMQSFGEGDLASRVKVCKRRLKKHFKMEHFVKMKLSMLKRYADAFDIPLVNMFQLLVVPQQDTDKVRLTQKETANPYLSVTKVEAAIR